ncbi:MAG: rhodanese-like domain-containing protein [Nitrosopumilus sp.]|nr:rhodanese-like domain-containing protein [Nitrosopumilus sp.]
MTSKTSTPKSLSFHPKIMPKLRIKADYLKENLNHFVILDARTPQEFMMGHLPNSKLCPFTEGISYTGNLFQDKAFLQKMFSQIGVCKDSEIVCYCMHGHRASSLFFQLLIAGYDKLKLYDGSFVEWHGMGFPLE